MDPRRMITADKEGAGRVSEGLLLADEPVAERLAVHVGHDVVEEAGGGAVVRLSARGARACVPPRTRPLARCRTAAGCADA
jgi:hypothetical protein